MKITATAVQIVFHLISHYTRGKGIYKCRKLTPGENFCRVLNLPSCHVVLEVLQQDSCCTANWRPLDQCFTGFVSWLFTVFLLTILARGNSFEDTVFKKGIHFIHLMIVSTITESRPTVDNFTVEDPVS